MGVGQMCVPKSGLVVTRVSVLPPASHLAQEVALNRLLPYLNPVKNRPPCAFGSLVERSNGFAAPGKWAALPKPDALS